MWTLSNSVPEVWAQSSWVWWRKWPSLPWSWMSSTSLVCRDSWRGLLTCLTRYRKHWESTWRGKEHPSPGEDLRALPGLTFTKSHSHQFWQQKAQIQLEVCSFEILICHFTETGVWIYYALPMSRMTSKCGKEWGFSGVGKDYQSVRSVAIMLQLRHGFRNASFLTWHSWSNEWILAFVSSV